MQMFTSESTNSFITVRHWILHCYGHLLHWYQLINPNHVLLQYSDKKVQSRKCPHVPLLPLRSQDKVSRAPQLQPTVAWDREDHWLNDTEHQENKQRDTCNMLLPFLTTVLFYPGHYFSFPTWNNCIIQEYLQASVTTSMSTLLWQRLLSCFFSQNKGSIFSAKTVLVLSIKVIFTLIRRLLLPLLSQCQTPGPGL